MPVVEDKQKLKKCHIAVGTPGICHWFIFVVKLCDQSNKILTYIEVTIKLINTVYNYILTRIYDIQRMYFRVV